jgi:hypothetical protein
MGTEVFSSLTPCVAAEGGSGPATADAAITKKTPANRLDMVIPAQAER